MINKIVEKMFFPHAIQKEIDVLRLEGKLNEIAVNTIYKNVLREMFVFFVCGAFLMYYKNGFYWGIVLLGISPFIVRYNMKALYFKQFASYLYGKKEKATYQTVLRNIHGLQNLRCIQSLEPYKDIDIKLHSKPRLKKEEFPKENSEITIFISEDKRFFPVVDLEPINLHYSLTTKNL